MLCGQPFPDSVSQGYFVCSALLRQTCMPRLALHSSGAKLGAQMAPEVAEGPRPPDRLDFVRAALVSTDFLISVG